MSATSRKEDEEWAPRRTVWPPHAVIDGRWARLEPLDPARHAGPLHAAGHDGEAARAIWTFMSIGPFADEAAFRAWAEEAAARPDPILFAIRPRTGAEAEPAAPRGMAGLLNIRPRDGVIELGSIWFAPDLQRTRAATEALFLLMSRAIDGLGYRRLEWKCDARNAASRRAAARLGFRFEGVFPQHMIIKGRNRDTAWFSILDREWPETRAAIAAWLDPANFDEAGRARTALSAATAPLARPRDPAAFLA